MKRVFVFGLVIVSSVFFFLFQSCGVSGKKKIVLRYSAPGFATYNKIREDIGKEFEKLHPEVTMVYEPISGQGFFEKIQVQMASGSEPDVFFMRDFELPIFAQKGTLLSLNDFVKNDAKFDLSDFYKILIDSYTVDGQIYGLPGSFTTGVVYYNKNILDENGVKKIGPMNWNELLQLGRKLTRKKDDTVVQFGLVLEYNDWLTFILQNGGEIYSKDKKQCVIYSDNAVKAITFLKKLFTVEHIMPNNSDLQQSSAYQMFMLGKAGLFTGGRWYTALFKDISAFHWGIAPFFYNKKKATRLDSHSWVISKHTKHPKLAWEFLKFMTSRQGNWKMVEVGDSVPIHKSDTEKFIKLNPENKVFLDSIKYAYTVDKVMSPYITWSQQQVIMKEEFDKFVLGKTTASQTLQNIQKRINTEIRKKL